MSQVARFPNLSSRVAPQILPIRIAILRDLQFTNHEQVHGTANVLAVFDTLDALSVELDGLKEITSDMQFKHRGFKRHPGIQARSALFLISSDFQGKPLPGFSTHIVDLWCGSKSHPVRGSASKNHS